MAPSTPLGTTPIYPRLHVLDADHTLAFAHVANLTPFGVAAGPQPDHPIPRLALRAAFVQLCRYYQRSPLILDRIERALQLPDDAITIHATGDLTVRGTTGTYRVTATTCDCPDFWARGGQTTDLCKHRIRRELLRLAQALHTAAAVADMLPATATVVLPPTALHAGTRACARAQRALAAQTAAGLTILVANRLLLLWQGGHVLARLTGSAGDGVSHIPLRRTDLATMQTVLHTALARPTIPTITLSISAGGIELVEQVRTRIDAMA